jgi:hypothetical protein
VSFIKQSRHRWKRELFARIAEHLNDLALEVEKATATSGADVPYAADHEQAARSRRMLPWLLVFVLAAIAGAFFWANHRTEKDSSSVTTVKSTEQGPQDDAKQAIAALLSGEQGERKVLTEQLGALAARVDHLERALASLERARAEIARPSNKESVGAEESPPLQRPNLQLQKRSLFAEEKRNSTEKPA